jgi:hypothetical protein
MYASWPARSGCRRPTGSVAAAAVAQRNVSFYGYALGSGHSACVPASAIWRPSLNIREGSRPAVRGKRPGYRRFGWKAALGSRPTTYAKFLGATSRTAANRVGWNQAVPPRYACGGESVHDAVPAGSECAIGRVAAGCALWLGRSGPERRRHFIPVLRLRRDPPDSGHCDTIPACR